jgi:hypothetical protein
LIADGNTNKSDASDHNRSSIPRSVTRERRDFNELFLAIVIIGTVCLR